MGMGTATELERLVVRLVGEGSDYERVLDDAVAQTEQAARKIEALTEKEMAQQNASMEEAARVVQAVITPMERYEEELGDLERLYKTGYISQETYTRGLKQATSVLPSVREAQAKYNEQLQRAKALTESVQTPTERYRIKLAEVERLYRQGAISGAVYNRVLASLSKEFVQGGHAVQAFGQKVASAGRSVRMFGMMSTAAVTLPVIGMIASYGKFDDAITQSTAIAGGVTADLRKEMEETARSIARDSITSAEDLARSYYYLISAGLDVEQSMAALSVVEKFAVAGMFDMAGAAELLMGAQSALGLKSLNAQENMKGMLYVANLLSKANIMAQGSVEEFSAALTNEAAAAIKQFNLDTEESMAIIAAFADQNIKGADAGSLFARMIRLLIKSINDNPKVFKRLNIDVKEFAVTGKNLMGVFEDITRATADMGPVQKGAILDQLGFNALVQQAILPLLGVTEKVRRYKEGLKEISTAMQEIVDKQLTSFISQLKIVWHRVKEVSEEIGEGLAPYIIMIGDRISSCTDYWRKINEETKTAITLSIGLTAVLGPLAFAVGGVAIAVGLLTGVLGKLMIAGFAAMASWAVWVVPVALVAAGMLAVNDALVKMGLATSSVDTGFLDFLNSIKIGGTSIGAWTRVTATYFWQTWDWAVSKAKASWETLKDTAIRVSDKIKSVVGWDEGLTASEKRYQEHKKKLADIDAEYARQSAVWDDVRLRNFNEEMEAAGKKAADLSKPVVAAETGNAFSGIAGMAEEEALLQSHRMQAMADMGKSAEEMESMAKSAEAVFKEVQTPQEIFTDKVVELNKMLDAGALSFETYNRAIIKYQEELDTASKKTDEFAAAADALTQEVRTPQEVFSDKITELNEMLGVGEISPETYNRALGKYQDELNTATKKTDAFSDTMSKSFDAGPVDSVNNSLQTQSNLLDKLHGKALVGKISRMVFGEPQERLGSRPPYIPPSSGMPTFGMPTFGMPTFGMPTFGMPTFGMHGAAPRIQAFEAPRATTNRQTLDMQTSNDWSEMIRYLRQIAMNTSRGVPAVAV